MSFWSQVAPAHSIPRAPGGGDSFPSSSASALAAARAALSGGGGVPWREGIFVHHQRVGAGSYCGPGHNIDQIDNNFIAVRHFPGSQQGNLLYAEFQWANGTATSTSI